MHPGDKDRNALALSNLCFAHIARSLDHAAYRVADNPTVRRTDLGRWQHEPPIRLIMPRLRAERSTARFAREFSVCRQIGGPHIMLKPPLMLITWPVIQPQWSEARSATVGAMSAG